MLPYDIAAQFSGSLKASYQLGKLTNDVSNEQSNLYNMINLRYKQENFSLGLKAENYFKDGPYEYSRISQKYVRYNNDNLQIEAGNFYEILGRGVLLRGYEIPGSVYQDGATKQRYGFYKDIEGLSIHFSNDYFEAKFLYGRPLNNLIPPAFKRKIRRPFLIHGGEINYIHITEFNPGVLFLSREINNVFDNYSGFNLQGIFSDFQYYLEYTQDINKPFLTFSNKTAHGFYGSMSYGFDFVYSTFEYKDYYDYALGFNDPPILSREHSYTLLNRSTIFGEPDNEKGYQAELLFNIGQMNTVTLNHAHTRYIMNSNNFNFNEYYGDINFYVNETWLAKLFVDYAEDELKKEANRFTIGAFSEDNIFNLWSYSTELQYQMFERFYTSGSELNHEVNNYLFLFSVNQSPHLSISLSYEIAKDPIETNTLVTGNRSKEKHWRGFNIIYNYTQNNTFSIFYGSRRGGNACIGGICYQIQPFEGIELGLSSRF